MDPEQNQNETTEQPRMSQLLPPQVQVTLPKLRESQLPQTFPLSEVNVLYPVPKKLYLKTVMFYKIDFVWNGENKTISRRFSEIENLREAFQSLLPFTFIYPVHRKKLLVDSKE